MKADKWNGRGVLQADNGENSVHSNVINSKQIRMFERVIYIQRWWVTKHGKMNAIRFWISNGFLPT